MRRQAKVIAILCSDIHLSLRPPVARAGEPDWLKAQERVLDQLIDLQSSCGPPHPPVLCAGDIFHKWNSPVELANWALIRFPWMIAIPGQHDLPYHSRDLKNRSIYTTMVLGSPIEGGMEGLEEGEGWDNWPEFNLYVQGFPWGVPLTQAPGRKEIQVALIHQYVWIKGHSYPGAPEESTPHNLFGDGMGWDVIVCGDNHKGFITKTKAGTVIFNCGGLQRRQSDEIDYHPQVGLLRADGSVEPHFLDISQDIISSSPTVKNEEEDNIQLEDFLEQLKGLQGSELDFQAAVHHAMDDREVDPSVRRILLEAMES